MIKLSISHKKEDKYTVIVNKIIKKTRTTSSLVMGHVCSEIILNESGFYEITIRRTFLKRVLYALSNIISALGLLGRNEFMKINNKMNLKCQINKPNEGDIIIVVSSINEVIDNRIVLKGDVSFIEAKNAKVSKQQ